MRTRQNATHRSPVTFLSGDCSACLPRLTANSKPLTCSTPLELVHQFSDFGFKGGGVAVGVGKHGAKAGVKFEGARLSRDLGNIGMGDAGPGKDQDGVPRRRDEFCQRSEEHTSELQSRTVISYAVFCLKKKKKN